MAKSKMEGKGDPTDGVPAPIKTRRLREKQEKRQLRNLKDLLRDSRSASEIAAEASEDDSLLQP